MPNPLPPKALDLLIEAVRLCKLENGAPATVRYLEALQNSLAPPRRQKGRPAGTRKYDQIGLLLRMVREVEHVDRREIGTRLARLADDLHKSEPGKFSSTAAGILQGMKRLRPLLLEALAMDRSKPNALGPRSVGHPAPQRPETTDS
jgi:hypothetical protein